MDNSKTIIKIGFLSLTLSLTLTGQNIVESESNKKVPKHKVFDINSIQPLRDENRPEPKIEINEKKASPRKRPSRDELLKKRQERGNRLRNIARNERPRRERSPRAKNTQSDAQTEKPAISPEKSA
jgi:hypothetical protein